MKTAYSQCIILRLILLFTILPIWHAADALAYDYRRLPKATFPSYSNAGSQPRGGGQAWKAGQVQGGAAVLPSCNGVHLTDGQDRPDYTPAKVYNPGEPTLNFALVRWEKSKMPLKIWISPGVKLPEIPFSELQKTRVDDVTALLNSDDPFVGCSRCPGWQPETNFKVAQGIELWRPFEREGLFSFGFVDDPRKADIMVFFVDAFKDSTSPGGIMVGGNTSAQLYPIAQAHAIRIKQKPVVIELSLLVNDTDEKVQAATAHEFGHALGIKAHSEFRQDIMHENRVVNQLSPSDSATIRYLYRTIPAYVM